MDAADETSRALALQRELLLAAIEVVKAQREVIGQLHLPHLPAAQNTSDRSHPHDKDWRTWRGFCLVMQRLASEVRRLQRGRGHVSKLSVATRASVSEKTISRTMRGYGLDPRADWPPFDWLPDEESAWSNPDRRS